LLIPCSSTNSSIETFTPIKNTLLYCNTSTFNYNNEKGRTYPNPTASPYILLFPPETSFKTGLLIVQVCFMGHNIQIGMFLILLFLYRIKCIITKNINYRICLILIVFGAGNLVLPPLLGYNAGSDLFWVSHGFMITAVVIPILGVLAHAKLQGTMFDFGKKSVV